MNNPPLTKRGKVNKREAKKIELAVLIQMAIEKRLALKLAILEADNAVHSIDDEIGLILAASESALTQEMIDDIRSQLKDE